LLILLFCFFVLPPSLMSLSLALSFVLIFLTTIICFCYRYLVWGHVGTLLNHMAKKKLFIHVWISRNRKWKQILCRPKDHSIIFIYKRYIKLSRHQQNDINRNIAIVILVKKIQLLIFRFLILSALLFGKKNTFEPFKLLPHFHLRY
jgi:hypothetical protein